MSLADELLADLEDLSEGVDDDDLVGVKEENSEGEGFDGFDAEGMDLDNGDRSGGPRQVAKLLDSHAFQDAMREMETYMGTERTTVLGPVEEDPEYKLIVRVNNLTVDIDAEVGVLHKYVRDIYHKRFPELEQLIMNPIEYLRTAQLIGMSLL